MLPVDLREDVPDAPLLVQSVELHVAPGGVHLKHAALEELPDGFVDRGPGDLRYPGELAYVVIGRGAHQLLDDPEFASVPEHTLERVGRELLFGFRPDSLYNYMTV